MTFWFYIGSVDMHQDTENSHVVTILIDATKDIEYKFIVDGEWKYAMDLPHRTDWRKSLFFFFGWLHIIMILNNQN